MDEFLLKNTPDPSERFEERYRDLRLEDQIEAQMCKVIGNPFHPMHRHGKQYAHLLPTVNNPTQLHELRVIQRRC